MNKPNKSRLHVQGPGLKILSNETWHGPGHCGLCGDKNSIPLLVRWWDPDHGWDTGTLCKFCGERVAPYGPNPSDPAYEKRESCKTLDGLTPLMSDDLDALHALWEDYNV